MELKQFLSDKVTLLILVCLCAWGRIELKPDSGLEENKQKHLDHGNSLGQSILQLLPESQDCWDLRAGTDEVESDEPGTILWLII